jgi:hypothetical protein
LFRLRGEEGNKSFGFGLIDNTEREVIFGDKFKKESTKSFVMRLLLFWLLIKLIVCFILLYSLHSLLFFHRCRDIWVVFFVVRLVIVCTRQSAINYSRLEISTACNYNRSSYSHANLE